MGAACRPALWGASQGCAPLSDWEQSTAGAGTMPGPAAQPARQFFNAKNTLERKHLGEFLHELAALQVRATV